ncbi:MAG: 4-alpha-glucanotransferase [Candidatus Omnitrophica bacterium]|nr:4-alpha-glucanotransferase [Candidatus Omnitrophota bacterium]
MPPSQHSYESFLESRCKTQWQRIGIQRRSGVAVPLFSLYSQTSCGIGEIPDLKLLIDWCGLTGMSMIQLLPMNDTGFMFTPYDAQSTFALDPMYLSLEKLKNVSLEPLLPQLNLLRKRYAQGQKKINYGIKGEKLKLLWETFNRDEMHQKDESYKRYKEDNSFWLQDYALFKTIKELQTEKGWMDWPEIFKTRDAAALNELAIKEALRIEFHRWLQWQLYEQFKEIKTYAQKKNIFLMGDLPFLVSRDSADIWAHQNYFKLNLSSGAPPDAYFTQGQRWGMPPYAWPEIEKHGYDYLIEKLKYAENFYDMFRIDHAVGLFRLWTIDLAEPEENAGMNGQFDPQDEQVWEEHGRKILEVMVSNTSMLPCAEDLGTVPECSYRVLEDYAIPGMDVQRWQRDWQGTKEFKDPATYRRNSIAVVSTHDMSSLLGWWEFECATVEEELFKRMCSQSGLNFDQLRPDLFDEKTSLHGRLRWRDEITDDQSLLKIIQKQEHEAGQILDAFRSSRHEKEKFLHYIDIETKNCATVSLVREALRRAGQAASIYSVQQLIDWLALSPQFKENAWSFRINWPGSFGDHNWTLRMPFSLEEMLKLGINSKIKTLNKETSRL